MIGARLALSLGALAAVALVCLGFYWSGRRDGAIEERPRTEAALARAEVAARETQGARVSAARVDVVLRRREAAAEVAATLIPQALQAEDADAPLDADRAARLGRADRKLCELAPDLKGCATDRDAGRG
ncbi:hypothetical protein M9M90_14035 [Phenylobacterium sp. LH3H17]|uniref:hypothetical protein n=1 Tax=Phenylobacterium sp. LH3H17 TaxID=2903901 RepID=UPI0020C9B312|nr:hypothetical protein [Phenylobacterium sp. LH3H17]UTP38331.1 hypothetical protein M9M90_14035 [Phenylobacterium sp. LH3H17]